MKILFIQVSDIHWRQTSFPEESRALTAGSAISFAISESPELIIMIYSGDFVWSGKNEDYLAVKSHLEKFEKSISEVYPHAKIERVVCPGNHDCDFSNGEEIRATLIDKSIQESLFKGEIFDGIINTQKEFFTFARDFAPRYRDRTPLWNQADTRLGWVQTIETQEGDINILALNTAWTSIKREEPGKIHFPSGDFSLKANGILLNIAMFHHPFSWMNANSSHELRSKILKHADMVFSGHEHQQLTLTLREEIAQNECKIFEGGAYFDHANNNNDGFGILFLNTETHQALHYNLRWIGTGYELFQGDNKINLAESTPEFFEVRNTISNIGVKYTEDFLEWMDNPELPLTTSRDRSIKLSEIYVFPELKKAKLKSSQKSDDETIKTIDRISNQQFTLILGPTNSGKTSLAKALCRDSSLLQKHPLYLDGKRLKANLSNFAGYIQKNITQQYGEYADIFKNTKNSEKILIIDDFHVFASTTKNEKIKSTLDGVRHKFGRLVLLANDIELGPLELSQFITETSWGEGSVQYMLPFSYRKRNELIEKWFNVDAESLNQKEIANKRLEANKTLDVIIGRNFVQPFPAYILAVLQGIETGSEVDISTSTHGHLYEIFIKTCLAKKTTSTNYNIFSNFLGLLAYRAFSQEVDEISDDFISIAHRDFEEEYDLTRDLGNLKRDLLEVGLLVRVNGLYCFSERFVLYYFVAYYIKDRLSDPSIRQFVTEMASKLWVEDYANVMLFLVHLSKDQFIVDEMLKSSSTMFSSIEPARLEEDIEFLNNIGKDQIEISCPSNPSTEDRVDELEKVGKESIMPEFRASTPRSLTEKEVNDVARVNAAIKSMQLIGQVLKNFPASFVATRKVEMAEHCMGLGLRCLGFYYSIVEEHQDEMVGDILNILSPSSQKESHQEKQDKAKMFVLGLCRIATFGLIKRISYAIGSRELAKTYNRIFSGDVSNAKKLIDVSLMLDHHGDFPEKKILDLQAEWASASHFVSMQLRMLVTRHFKLFDVPFNLKSKIANKLSIKLVPSDNSGSKTKFLQKK